MLLGIWSRLSCKYSIETCEEEAEEFNLETYSWVWININANTFKFQLKMSTSLGYFMKGNSARITPAKDNS